MCVCGVCLIVCAVDWAPSCAVSPHNKWINYGQNNSTVSAGIIFTGLNQITRIKSCRNATPSTTNPAWIDLGTNQCLGGETRATSSPHRVFWRIVPWTCVGKWEFTRSSLGTRFRRVVLLTRVTFHLTCFWCPTRGEETTGVGLPSCLPNCRQSWNDNEWPVGYHSERRRKPNTCSANNNQLSQIFKKLKRALIVSLIPEI